MDFAGGRAGTGWASAGSKSSPQPPPVPSHPWRWVIAASPKYRSCPPEVRLYGAAGACIELAAEGTRLAVPDMSDPEKT